MVRFSVFALEAALHPVHFGELVADNLPGEKVSQETSPFFVCWGGTTSEKRVLFGPALLNTSNSSQLYMIGDGG